MVLVFAQAAHGGHPDKDGQRPAAKAQGQSQDRQTDSGGQDTFFLR